MARREARFDAFVSRVVKLDGGAFGPLQFGVVDAGADGVAEGISLLLTRSIRDARATVGGHLPDWLVHDIENNYVSAEKVRTLWAPTGHRFAVVLEGEIVGTVHVTRAHDTIFTVDRNTINVSSREHPGFKPERMHHVVNMSVRHELRRAHLGRAMFDGVVGEFRELFDGDGLWVRADPPWHDGLVGLGFVHDPRGDIFLPASAERTADLPHADFNARNACSCPPEGAWELDARAMHNEAMREQKLQYVSFTRPWQRALPAPRARVPVPSPLEGLTTDPSTCMHYAHDVGGLDHGAPSAVAWPRSEAEVAELFARATAHGARVRVRGRGMSAAGQSVGAGEIAVSTEHLRRITELTGDTVTVECGVTWGELVHRTAAHGLVPAVLPAYLGVTVGGTLSTGGFGKGSARAGYQADHVRSLKVATGDGRIVTCTRTHAAWLFEAALFGLGRSGMILEATLPLMKKPDRVTTTKQRVSEGDLLSELSASDASLLHATSFATPDGSWTLVRSSSTSTSTSTSTFDEFIGLDAPAPSTAAARWLQVFVKGEALLALLAMWRPLLRLGASDSLSVVPVREVHTRRVSLFPSLDTALVFGVLLTREQRSVVREELDAEIFRLASLASNLGARISLAGALPRDPTEWRARLGDAYEDVVRRKQLADPGGIFGGSELVSHA